MKKLLNISNNIIKKIKKTHLSEYTASCAYFTILAFIPLLMLVMTIAKYIGIDSTSIINIYNGIIPKNILNEFIFQIIEEVNSKSIGTITISAIFILWSAGRGFFALSKGLNSAYEIKDKRNYIFFKLKSIICTIIFIVVIMLILIISIISNQNYNYISKVFNILIKIRFIITLFALFIIFIVMYRFIPKHKSKIKDQIPGAMFSAICCNIVSMFYAVYVNLFRGFSFIYGSLTSIALAMMWLYACMYSILIGAVINNEIINNRNRS